jgi:hypothetical protein
VDGHELAQSNWMFATVNRDEDSEPLDFPEPIPRPGEPSDVEAPALPNPAEVIRFLGQ